MGLRDRIKGALGLGARTHLKPGDAAPELGVADSSGRIWTLADLRGKPAVVYFYPKDDTPGCTREACDFRDRWGELSARATLLGVSTDEAHSHTAFARKFNLPFPLLADTTGAMTERWGAKGRLGARRVTVLVGADGRVLSVWDPVEVQGHADAVLAAIPR